MLKLILIVVLAVIIGGCAVAPGYGSAQPYSEGYVSDYPYGYAPAYSGVYIGGWGDDHYWRSGYGRGRDHGYWSHPGGGWHGQVAKLGPAVATAVPDMAVVTVAATVNNLVLVTRRADLFGL